MFQLRGHVGRTGRLLLILAGAAAVAVHAGKATNVVAANLIVNGSFQQTQSSKPVGWVLDDAVNGRGELSIDRTGAHSSKAALQLSPNSRNTLKDKPFGVGQLISAAGLKGKTVRIAASMKAEGGATAQFIAFAITNDFKPLGHEILVESSPQFRPQSGSLAVDAQAAQILVGCVVVGQRGRAWFTDLTIEPVPPSASITPPEHAPDASDNSEIVVDARKIIRPIPRLLYGTNVEWINDANGIWDARASRFDAEILRAAKELGVTLVRFPGGIFADYYHWKDGVGPRATRPVRPHVADQNRSANGFGTAELVEFSRQIGAEPLLQVNIVTGTPEEAAAWVSYCNDPGNLDRIRDGAREPFRVRYWEIGNEQYGKADNRSTWRSSLTAEEYANRYVAFAAAMRKADPTIQLVAAGGVNSARYIAVTNNDWDHILLQRAGSAMDFLAVHDAYAPVAASASHTSFDDVYRALFAFPQLVYQNLAMVADQIAVTEWGPLFQAIPSDPWVDHPKTLGSGLYVALAMQVFLRAPEVGMANFFKLTEHSFLGSIGPGGEPKPSYFALQAYTKHFGDLLLDTQETGPRFSAREVGNVAAVQAAPLLNVVSSLSSDHKHLFLVAVNTSSTTGIRTRIRLTGFHPAPVGKVWLVSGPSLDSNNGDDLPAVPGLKWAKQASATSTSFQEGHSGLIRPKEFSLEDVADQFFYFFPPLSIISIELSRAA